VTALLPGLIVGWKRARRYFRLPGRLLLLVPLTALATFLFGVCGCLLAGSGVAGCLAFVRALRDSCLLVEFRQQKGWTKAYVLLIRGAGSLLLALLTYWHAFQ